MVSSPSSYGANAPEVDHNAHAPEFYHLPPEVDQSANAPQFYSHQEGLQVKYGDDPQVHYNRVAPEVPVNTDPPYPAEEKNENFPIPVPSKLRTGRKRLVILVGSVALLVALAIGLGVGLGVGLPKQKSSSPSPADSPAATSTTSLPTSTTSTPSTTTSAVPENLTNGALPDTSLASVLTSDGNRHLFFQDINSTLRHAVYFTSTNGWHPQVDFIDTPTVPRNNTPLAAMEAITIVTGGVYVNIYYVDTNNNLRAVQFSDDTTPSNDQPSDLMNGTFSVAPDSRSLSIARLDSAYVSTSLPSGSVTSNVMDQALLYYESPTHNVTVLHGIFQVNRENGNQLFDKWLWQNASDLMYPSNSGATAGGWIAAPFSVTGDKNSPNPSTDTFSYFFNPESVYNDKAYYLWSGLLTNFSSLHSPSDNNITVNDGLQGTLSQGTPYRASCVSTLASGKADILVFQALPYAVLNGSLWNEDYGSPSASFSYARIAYLATNTTVYFYHQLNESILLEESVASAESSNGWGSSTYINVPAE